MEVSQKWDPRCGRRRWFLYSLDKETNLRRVARTKRGLPSGSDGKESESHSVVSDSLQPNGLYSPWNSPGKNTGVGSLSLLQGIFPTQGSYPCLPHYRWILSQLSHQASPDGKESACSAGDLGSIPGSGKSLGEGHGNPFQYSFLENPMDRRAWQAVVPRVAQSDRTEAT